MAFILKCLFSILDHCPQERESIQGSVLGAPGELPCLSPWQEQEAEERARWVGAPLKSEVWLSARPGEAVDIDHLSVRALWS